ncbi:MAG TPA: YciI family protein [Pyrinomonadaceae bacterium]
MNHTNKQRILFSLPTLVLSLMIGNALSVQPARAQEMKLVEFHMAVLKVGPNWKGMDDEAHKKVHAEHITYFEDLVKSGRAVLGGPFTDEGEIKGVIVFRAKNADEARTWAESAPAVKSGYLIAEMHPWWSAEVMKPANVPLKLTKAYFAFLTRGPKWTPERTTESAEIQKAHMANINRLAEMKKLVIAGPFGDNGTLRGIFVFKVGSLEEAKQLADTDPAVQAGRLALEVRPWLVPDGMLP